MNGTPRQRRMMPGQKSDLRLEGLVVQKRLGRAEATRYLEMDMNMGSIAVYKKPPPKEGADNQRSKSMPSKLMASITPKSLTRANSDESGKGNTSTMFENLAHISREKRYAADSSKNKRKSISGATVWEPKFKASSAVDWKIRDVENDETMFYLILPADFKKHDADAELFETTRFGNSISYRNLADISPGRNSLDSVPEGEETTGEDTRVHSSGSVPTISDNDDNSSVSSTGSKKKWSPMGKKSRCISSDSQEVVYQYRVLLDGNEKFIWLQAAAELGRLCPIPAVSMVSSTVDATKKLFVLPMTIGSGRSNLTALRYAEWARLIDQKKNVTQFHFDVHDISQIKAPQDKSSLDDSSRYNSTRLVKVIPTYAYRNRRMTEKDLYYEMTTTSERWEDLRSEVVGDRDEEIIGSLHAEVLACHGLPKLDKLSSTDAVCYFACGPYAFASDVIDGFLSPVWPSKSRRACIFPLFQAYQKLYAAIFDDDGPGAHDDFAGRVVVDLARLRPGSVYDIFLPLRLYQNAYVKKSRGVIHLRLRVEWNDEKKALLSYLKLPKKTELLGNAVTVNCADYKAFRNVVLTVQGKDVPGRYKQMIQKGLQREMKLYKFVMKTAMKEQMKDIIFYVHPLLSFSIFIAWMHCVYCDDMAYVPVYIVAGVLALLLRNYVKYGIDEDFHFGFSPITLKEVFKVLLFGGPGTNIIKPIKVGTLTTKTTRGYNEDEESDMNLHESVFKGEGFKMDGDHMEFPFSESGRYAKKTLAEACVDASAIFAEDEEEEEEQKTSGFASFTMKAKKSSQQIGRRPKASREDDEEDEEDEFGLIKSNPDGDVQISLDNSVLKKKTSADNDESKEVKVPDEIWKRVSDPRGLPEQDATVLVKSRKTLKEEIIHNKNLMHKMSLRLFDDRMYIVNEGESEAALDQAIGTNKYKNPMVAKIAEYVAPGLEGLKVGLSVWRAGFNLFTWQDPYLTSLFFFGVIVILCVLIIFPWRVFFFIVGIGAVGPQNLLIRIFKKNKPKKVKKADQNTPSSPKSAKKKNRKTQVVQFSADSVKKFQFHNHLTTDQGVDVREERYNKSTTGFHRAVVPNSPLISRRFYDWPPNPSLSDVEIYSE